MASEDVNEKVNQNQLTPTEASAIRRWSTFGQKGTPPTDRVTSAGRKLKPFDKPATATWDQVIPQLELPKLLLGFQPRAMEGKWVVYVDGPDAQGKGIVHMHRSWTGMKMFEARFSGQVDEDGKAVEDARFTEITWESSHGVVEEKAKQWTREVCGWCMDMKMD